MSTQTISPDTMFGSVIKLLNGDRPLESDRRLYDAAISIRNEMQDLELDEKYEVETLLACGVSAAGNLPSLFEEARARVQSPYALRNHPADGLNTVDAICDRIRNRLLAFRAARVASYDGTAADALRTMMEEQRVLHPKLGLSFGYIGNCDFGGHHDDRSWKIFTKLATPACHNACDVSFGGYPTTQLGKFMQIAMRDLANWCNEQERRLAAGEIRIVGKQ